MIIELTEEQCLEHGLTIGTKIELEEASNLFEEVEFKVADKDDLVYFENKWGWDVNQIVLIRQYDHRSNYVDIIGIISEVTFQGLAGAPICTVNIVNKWSSGEWGGEIPITMMVNRYISPEPIIEEHLALLDEYPDKEYLFYTEERIDGTYKVYPFKESKMTEARKLIPVTITHSGSMYTLKWKNEDKNRSLVFNGNDEQLAKFLMKNQAKDNATDPKSSRGITYNQMVADAKSGKDNVVWIWSTFTSKFPPLINIK